jgi:hypothetical protein
MAKQKGAGKSSGKRPSEGPVPAGKKKKNITKDVVKPAKDELVLKLRDSPPYRENMLNMSRYKDSYSMGNFLLAQDREPIPGFSNLPLSVNMHTMEKVELGDWVSPTAARQAADTHNHYYAARYMGDTSLTIMNITQKQVADLIDCKKWAPGWIGLAKYGRKDDEQPTLFSKQGEYPHMGGQVSIARLWRLVEDGKVNVGSEDKKGLLFNMYALQSPVSSVWKKPFIRIITNHHFDFASGTLQIRLHLYFSRLVFCLIADPAVKNVYEHLHSKPVITEPVYSRPAQPAMYTSVNTAIDRFSLAGLLKHAENKGYGIRTGQPEGLTVELFDYQLSTYQWMLDQENLPNGMIL